MTPTVRRRLAFASLVVVGAAVGAITARVLDGRATDLAAMQGTWKVTGVQSGDREWDDVDDFARAVRIEDRRLFFDFADGKIERYDMKLDDTTTPKRMVLAIDSPFGQQKVIAAYRLEGAKLTLWWPGLEPRVPPVDFGVAEHLGEHVVTLERP